MCDVVCMMWCVMWCMVGTWVEVCTVPVRVYLCVWGWSVFVLFVQQRQVSQCAIWHTPPP